VGVLRGAEASAALTELRDRLKSGLSATPHDPASEKGPTELADRIKVLKACNTIEATPQRPRQKQLAAEEPTTARIRRRQEASIDGELGAGENLASSPTKWTASAARCWTSPR
jgi:hypothetical protein